jgi:hypothetical protein
MASSVAWSSCDNSDGYISSYRAKGERQRITMKRVSVLEALHGSFVNVAFSLFSRRAVPAAKTAHLGINIGPDHGTKVARIGG